ncbi:MAG TPA: hypothetical protein VFR58_10710 [Flavisolibacter sp.]|nr:hypothetical protein [Flavisolibacter sp.]
MNNIHFFRPVLSLASLLFVLVSCDKDDDTPAEPVSRLYVSNADTGPSIQNLEVYNNADAGLSNPVKVASGASDGNGVVYDAGRNILFQAGRMSKTIFYFSNAGMLTSGSIPSGSFTDAGLSSARDIAYDGGSNTLFVANNTDSTLRIYAGASSATGNVSGRVVKLSAQPWGIFYEKDNNRLLVLMDNAAMRIEVFNNPASLTAGLATPNSVLNISDRPNGGKSRLHGLTYSSKLDVLLVTEIGEAAAPAVPDLTKPAFNADGGIYIIENAGAKLTAGGNVSANRTIYGSNTMMGNPVDIAFDDRDNKRLIYIAEKANKKLLVFKLSDNGNVSPSITTDVMTLPEAIYLDAR